MNFNSSQEKIIKTDAARVVVHASAGSGKTRCLVGRLQYLLDNGVNPEDIIAITFTNAAADEIIERLNKPNGMFIGTIHSLANHFLTTYGIHTFDLLEKEDFDGLFNRIKQFPACIKTAKHLLLDEGQDSSPDQFEFLLEDINPENWMIFADVRQSIYRWNGAYPDYIFELMERSDVTTYDLNENYRCGSKIIDFASSLIQPLGLKYKDRSLPARNEDGEVVLVEYSLNGLVQTIKRRVENGTDNYSDWFVLTRTNNESETVLNALKSIKIPCESFKKKAMSSTGLKEKMANNTVKVLTIHVSKGLEAKNVVVIGGKFRNTEERCICYVAATRARDLLVWTYEQSKTKKKKNRNMVNWE